MENYSHPDIPEILNKEGNSVCVDCGGEKPKWASMNNGVFLCLKCAGIHRSFGMSVSLIRSLQIDSWTEKQLLYLTKGGNKNFKNNLSEFNIAETATLDIKYKSKAADYYRKFLKNEVDRETEPNYVPTQIVKPDLEVAMDILEIKEEENEEKTEKKITLKETKKQKKGDIKSECFLKPEQSIMLDTKVKYNLDLLKMTLREIFSKNVSEKVKNYSKEHQLDYNKNFIEKIKDDERKEKTNAILDMTFLQCMEHYRGSKRYDVLSGLESEYEKDIEQMSDDVEYMENFIEHLKYFEVLYANKKSRNSKKKKMNEEEN